MKKIVTLILISIGVCSITLGQTAFYEAQALTKLSVPDLQNIQRAAISTAVPPATPNNSINLSTHELAVVNDYILFLQYPFNSTITSLDYSALQSAIKKYNDFLAAGPGTSRFLAGFPALLSVIPALTSGGGLTAEQQTNIIDGITKYYAEEFKKARTLTYMQVFEASIGRVGELEVVFPETYRKLATADPSRFPELGHEYKTIFNEDLKAAIDNVTRHIDNHTAAGNPALEARLTWLNAANVNTIRTHPVYPSAKIAMDVGSKLINGYHPADVFSFIDEKYYNASYITSNNLPEQKLALIFHGINLVQKNVLDTAKSKTGQFSNIWISLQDLESLNAQEWVNFAGLIYQQDKAFFNSFFVLPAGAGPAVITPAVKQKFQQVLATLIELRDLKNQMKDETAEANFIKYMQFALRTIQTTNYFNAASYPQFAQFLRASGYVMNLYDNARNKDYTNTAYYLVRLINEFLSTTLTNYAGTLAEVDKYVSFTADIINAENSDEVKELLKKHVAPPTSFLLKREFLITGSITGHPGYFAGAEKLKGEKKAKFVTGVTLPIGLEITFKTRRSIDNAGSIGIFAQVLDLGAVLNFRSDDETSNLPDKVEFEQVFSPGVSLTYGFKNSPLTLAAGYQYTPELRKITTNGNEKYPNGDRVFVRVGWDIPMVNIFKTRAK